MIPFKEYKHKEPAFIPWSPSRNIYTRNLLLYHDPIQGIYKLEICFYTMIPSKEYIKTRNLLSYYDPLQGLFKLGIYIEELFLQKFTAIAEGGT